MLNRRNFLKSGLTTGAAALPISAALQALNSSSALAAEGVVTASASPVKLAALPRRLAPIDPASEPWQKRVHRVGQSNMTEHTLP